MRRASALRSPVKSISPDAGTEASGWTMDRCYRGRRQRGWMSTSQGVEIQCVGLAQPERGVPMVAHLVVGVRMHEHIQCAVVQREPAHDMRKAGHGERQLVAPHRMWSDRLLVKAP